MPSKHPRTNRRASAAAAAEPPPQRTIKFGEEDARAVADEVGRVDVQITGDTAEGVTPYHKPPKRPDVEVPGLVLRPGRIVVNGDRKGARWVARRVVYLSPKHAAALESYARVHRMSLGEAVDRALEKAGIVGKAAAS